MPFVPAADAANARLTRIPYDRPDGPDRVHRPPLLASPAIAPRPARDAAGLRDDPHRHPGAGESFYILTGSGRFTIGDERSRSSPGRPAVRAGDEVHAIEAGAGRPALHRRGRARTRTDRTRRS